MAGTGRCREWEVLVANVVLSVEGISKRFDGLQAVDTVSFSISEGETYGLLGPNGAGKTTSISMIAGLLERDAGAVTIDGEAMDPTTVAPKRHVEARHRAVSHHPSHPGTRVLQPPDPFPVAEGGQEGVLGQLLGFGGITRQHDGQAQHRPVFTTKENLEALRRTYDRKVIHPNQLTQAHTTCHTQLIA